MNTVLKLLRKVDVVIKGNNAKRLVKIDQTFLLLDPLQTKN